MTEEQKRRFQQHFNDERFDAAFAVCTEAIRASSADWNAIYLAGLALRFQGDYTTAVTYYRRAIELRPDIGQIWQALGIALQQLRQYPEAIGALKAAIRLVPDDYASHNSLGLTYKLVGNHMAAMHAYEAALETCVGRALSEVRRDHPEFFGGDSRTLVIDTAAFEAVRLIIVTDFRYFNTLKNMITCCIAMGDHEKAAEIQDHVDTCTPMDIDIVGPFPRPTEIKREPPPAAPTETPPVAATVAQCKLFRFQCTQRWDVMTPTRDPNVHFCDQCKEAVYLCHSEAEVRERGRAGQCAALVVSPVERNESSPPPEEPPMFIGMPETGEPPPRARTPAVFGGILLGLILLSGILSTCQG